MLVRNNSTILLQPNKSEPTEMKKTLLHFFGFFLFFQNFVQAQIFTVAAGTTMNIKSGTIFSAGKLVLTPSADFTFSDISLTKNSIVSHAASNPYIARVYNFSGNTTPFKGSVRIDYNDGTELNGLDENLLQLNIHDGTSWNAYTATANDTNNNFVLTTTLTNTILNELTGYVKRHGRCTGNTI